MNIIYLLLPLALLLALVFVLFFLWAARKDQFEDLDTPGHRILLDDSPPPPGADKPQDSGPER